MSDAVDVEFVVVGGGVLGLSAARSLARRGREVIVCEQATVGHGAGGSKGSARIFRLGYDHPGYVRLAMVALRLWRQLEAESGTGLLTTTGQLTFGDDLHVLAAAMDAAGAAHQMMGPDDVATRFPTLSVPTPALFEPDSGVIAADRCLAALRSTPGVVVREGTRVLRVVPHAGGARLMVRSPGGDDELRTAGVVVCAGPWTAPLVDAPGTVLRPWPTLEQVAYMAPAAGSGPGATDDIPVFVERRRPWFYGLPVPSSAVVKVSLHGAGPRLPLDELEDDAAWQQQDDALVAELSASVRRLLPGLRSEPLSTERCLYDNTPDGDFVVDRVGGVVVGSGTSGHGFKFAPLLGEMLADLATGSRHDEELGTAPDLGRFTAGRLAAPGPDGGPTVHP